jgi:hypothetical protein
MRPADTPLPRLSELSPADREAVEAAVLRALSSPQAQGWEDWEQPELLAAVGRSQGVALSSHDMAHLTQ